MIRLLSLTFLTLLSLTSIGQTDVREHLYLHLNSSLLVTGETLYFSAYCQLKDSHQPSPLSQILYLELVGENGSVHKMKVALEDGRGYGDIFLTSILNSGRYQLLAYTQWMKNFHEYLQLPVTIINPFEAYPSNSEDKELAISFYPAERSFRFQQENLVGFHITGFGKGAFQGKVINDLGETKTTFTHDHLGVGSFKLTPQMDRSYQVILEDERRQIHFFDLPVVEQSLERTSRFDSFSTIPEVTRSAVSSTFTTREKVIIPLELGPGSYSVSVKKREETLSNSYSHAVISRFKGMVERTPIDIDLYFSTSSNQGFENLLLLSEPRAAEPLPELVGRLPEVREELITGRLKDQKGNGIADEIVLLAIPSTPFQLRATTTGQDGSFTMPFQNYESEQEGYLLPYHLDANLDISYDDKFFSEYPAFDYRVPKPDSLAIVTLVARSVRNQLENAYYETPAAIKTSQKWLPQLPFDYIYVLDDYVRFRTIKETFTEFVATVSARENREPVFKPFVPLVPDFSQRTPLVLLDGVPISPQKMLHHSPYKIESISVLNNRYFMGPLISDGVVLFESKEKVLSGFELDDNYVPVSIMPISTTKRYATVSYNSETVHSKIPDQRDQLYWNPSLTVHDEATKDITFFTSDVTGEFDVVIEGFSNSGIPYSKVITLTVEDKQM